MNKMELVCSYIYILREYVCIFVCKSVSTFMKGEVCEYTLACA